MEHTQNQAFVDKEQSKWKKILKTIVLVVTWICIGLCTEITGPTMRDLKLRTASSYEEISRAISGWGVGSFIGCFMGGFLVDGCPRFCNFMIGVCLCGMAGATVIVPHVPHTSLIWVLMVLQGAFEGVINIAGQKLIIEIWREKAASPMHILHLGFGVGSFIVPEICKPFLAPVARNTERVMPNDTSVANFTTATPQLKQSRIEWPYLIVSLISIALSVVFFAYQWFFGFRKKKIIEGKSGDLRIRTRTNVQQISSPPANRRNSGCVARLRSFLRLIDPGTCSGNRRVFGIHIFGLLFLYFFNAVGGERLYGKFVRTFAIDQLNFSGDDATSINTAFWVSFSIGRFVGFIAARWIPIRILIVIEAMGALVTGIALTIFASDNVTVFWILTQPMGFFIAPIFPSGIAWGDFHVYMSGVAITFLLLGASLGGVAYLWIIGYFYDHFGFKSFIYNVLAYGIIAAVLAFTMHFSTWGNKGRFEDKPKHISENNEEETDFLEK